MIPKEQIEYLGWECSEYYQDGYNQQYDIGHGDESTYYRMRYCEAWDGKWEITNAGSGVYWGQIPDIAALSKLMEWLGIATNKEDK